VEKEFLSGTSSLFSNRKAAKDKDAEKSKLYEQNR